MDKEITIEDVQKAAEYEASLHFNKEHSHDQWWACVCCFKAGASIKQIECCGTWVKCSDRLPEDGSTVLVTNGERVKEVLFSKRTSRDIPSFIFTTMKKDEITHWMPLPKSPNDSTCKVDELRKGTTMQYWECSNNGVRRYGESCNLNNNCKFPKCLNQIQFLPEEQLKKDLEDFKNAYVERNDKCNEQSKRISELEADVLGLQNEIERDSTKAKKRISELEECLKWFADVPPDVYLSQIRAKAKQLLK